MIDMEENMTFFDKNVEFILSHIFIRIEANLESIPNHCL